MVLAVLGIMAGWCVWDAAIARKHAERGEQEAKFAEARARALNLEAAASDRTEAAKRWEQEDAPAALAYLARAIHFNPQSSLAAEQAVSTLNAWKMPPELERSVAPDGIVVSAQFSPDGAYFLTNDFNPEPTPIPPKIRIWETATGKLVSELEGRDGQFSPDGKRLLAVLYNTVVIDDITTGQTVVTLRDDSGSKVAAEFSLDGTRVLTISFDGPVRIWEPVSGKLLATLATEDGKVCAEFSPDGKRVLTASGKAQVWDAATGKLLLLLGGENETGIGAAHYSPNGERIVTIERKTVRIWDATTGRLVAVLTSGHGDMRTAQFSPDSRRVATGSEELRVWDTATGKLLVAFGWRGRFSDQLMSQVEFSPDGSRLLSVAEKYSAKIWDAATGWLVAQLWTKDARSRRGDGDGAMRDAHFSADGMRIVTAAWMNRAQVWTLRLPNTVAPPVLSANAGPPPEWFPDFLSYMAERKLGAGDEDIRIPSDDLSALRQKLRVVLSTETNPKSPYRAVLRYYFKD